MLTVYTDEVVDPRWIEHAHLIVKIRAADERRDLLLFDVTRKHRARGVLEGGQDDGARVDERPVKIEQHGRIAHRK